jgi:hydrogenase expression/formation protein HypC
MPTSESPLNTAWPAGACTLDHDGCVVCSDAGIPLRVISLDGDDAICQDALGVEALIAIELVAPVQVGDILLTHGGVAIGRGIMLPPDADMLPDVDKLSVGTVALSLSARAQGNSSNHSDHRIEERDRQ